MESKCLYIGIAHSDKYERPRIVTIEDNSREACSKLYDFYKNCRKTATTISNESPRYRTIADFKKAVTAAESAAHLICDGEDVKFTIHKMLT